MRKLSVLIALLVGVTLWPAQASAHHNLSPSGLCRLGSSGGKRVIATHYIRSGSAPTKAEKRAMFQAIGVATRLLAEEGRWIRWECVKHNGSPPIPRLMRADNAPRGSDVLHLQFHNGVSRWWRQDGTPIEVVHTGTSNVCGGGPMLEDDSKVGNRNNDGMPGLQRRSHVNMSCLTGQTVLHELLHGFGAVQFSSPTSSGAHSAVHGDIMRSVTWKGIDVDGDSYFNTNPAPGSYLAEHFNIATDSVWIGASQKCPTWGC